MKDYCILCDFDGTITEKDGLYGFFEQYALKDWLIVEKLWEEGKINSQDCLKREFDLIPNLNEFLVKNYLKTVRIDEYFSKFQNYTAKNNIDFFIVSDGVDYFINETLNNYDIFDIKIISNHFEFINNKFLISFPYANSVCIKNSGTCKCAVIEKKRKEYKKIIYIGDGTSDYCAADKADILFAKNKLALYCQKNNINFIKFSNFNDIIFKLFYECITI